MTVQKPIARTADAAGTSAMLAHGIAHDLNNLLSIIMGHTELVRARSLKGMNIDKQLDAIHHTCQQASQTVEQIPELGELPRLSHERVELNSLLRETFELTHGSLPARVRCSLKLTNECLPVRGDKSALSNALINLIINARDALTHNRRPKITIESDYEPAPRSSRNMAVIRIHDNGCGIDPAMIDTVFEPFITTKRKGNGSGLGLAMVHHTVLAHRGMLAAQSTPGSHTTFTIRLPLLIGDEQQNARQ